MMKYESFVKDYNNMGLTTHDVRRINRLNSREYRELRNLALANGDIPKCRHMNSTGAKFYYQNPEGDWTVEKQFSNAEPIRVGNFSDEATAKLIRDKCIAVDWELDKIRDLINDKKIQKVKNYSLVNGYWIIQKTIKGKLETFLIVKKDKVNEDTIKGIVGRLRNVNWDKSYLDSILMDFNIY